MAVSFLEKFDLVFRNTFSSFLGIETLAIALLLFLFLVLNISRKSTVVKVGMFLIIVGFLFGVAYLNRSYTIFSIDYLIKVVMNYIYFPSTLVYFIIIVLSAVFIISSNFSKRMPPLKKWLDAIFFTIIYFLFFNFIIVVFNNKLDLTDKVGLYADKTVLSIIQLSNLFFVAWLIVLLFYKLYDYFKNNYDDSEIL
ncbi:MAG: hypothetical protein MSS28_03000 [Tenericutes bacterium]|nr:hypothetical protein [Mycoplasmatota bacterium]